MRNTQNGGVQSVSRAVSLLEALAGGGELGVTELGRRLGVHKATASRLLSTLARHRLVERNPSTDKYRLGPGLLHLASSVRAGLNLVEQARPVLEDLAARTRETVNLAVLDRDRVTHIDQVAGTRTIASVSWVGRTTPYHCTATGKVLLAFLSEVELERLLGAPLEACTPHSIVDPKRLRRQLLEVRARGWARAIEEYERGLNAVAAPVRGATGEVIAALSVSGNENPGILLYTRVRKSPYFHASRKHGVKLYSVYNHTYHPRHYGDPVDEYWHLLKAVTMWDVGVERQIEISGPDAFDFVNMMVPRDMHKCAVGQCKYVFITAPDGGIINDPVLLRLEENRFWLSLADSDVGLWAQGLAYNSGKNVTIREVDVAPVQIQGPKSRDLMVSLFGEKILDLPYYYLTQTELDGIRVAVSRTGYTSELGYEIYLHEATKHGVKLWNTVLEAGKPHDLRVIGPCHIRRIEGGILAFGCDIRYDTNPFEVDMGYKWMVDLDQEADFVGKKALERIKKEGPRRKLVGVEIEGKNLGTYINNEMIDVFPIYHEGRRIGSVTSACHSPRLEKNIGFAMVPIEHAQMGRRYEVETPHGRTGALTVPKPFIDPGKEIPKK
jgi:aminomethyltransferase